MIRMIDIDKISHHPDNPRKDLGDLAELADSVKQSGVLQNLTLVPVEGEADKYYAVIGNRRLRAAKLAGLAEVPCAIVDMDHKTQVATMLLENMQRVDLTVYEQAQGIQMMMDLGESVLDISEKIGFSETTIRRRVKLLELDQVKLEESTKRGATLMEYMELSKIKDIKKRNEVLEHIGTSEFNWRLSGAIGDQEKEEIKVKLIEKVSGFSRSIEDLDREQVETEYVTRLNYSEDAIEREIEIEEGKEYVYQVGTWGIEIFENIWGQVETEAERRAREQRERKRAIEDERDARIKEINTRTAELRRNFIYSLPNSRVKPYIGEIILLALEVRTSLYLWDEEYAKIFRLKSEDDDFDFSEVENEMLENPELSLLKIIYAKEMKRASYTNFRGEFSEDEGLDKLYEILIKMGYEMSEEEKQIKDGSHEIFSMKEED